MSTARICAWLLGRPPPRREPRRITTLFRFAVALAVLIIIDAAPGSVHAVISVAVRLDTAVLVVLSAAMLARRWLRGRKARGSRP